MGKKTYKTKTKLVELVNNEGSTLVNLTNEKNVKLCQAEVRKNLVLAELGRELTIPLRTLEQNCEFKKQWDIIQTKWHGEPLEQRARMKAYREKPEVKARIKASQKAYYESKKNLNDKQITSDIPEPKREDILNVNLLL